jgi:Cu/Ag efflux pump CusA
LIAPIVGSTLTTVVVFAPLGLLSGVVGQFFRALSLTLSAAVLVSLVLSLTLIPLLARAFTPKHTPHRPPGMIERAYASTLPRWLAHPVLSALTAVLLAALAYGGYMLVGSGFLPASDEGGFVIDYLTPSGSSLAATTAPARWRRCSTRMMRSPHSRRTGSNSAHYMRRIPRHPGAVEDPRRARSAGQISRTPASSVKRRQIRKSVLQLLQDMLGDLEASDPIEVKILAMTRISWWRSLRSCKEGRKSPALSMSPDAQP